MLEFREPCIEDERLDGCGNTTMAILKINGCIVPLCEECLESLREDIKSYDEKIFCHKCNNFIMSKAEWNYGGSCKHKAKLDSHELSSKDAGFLYFVDCFDTCENADNKMNKKYELTNETMLFKGHTLHRIIALRDFGNVEKGDKGGWIEKEENLSHEGECWVYEDAQVYDNARVYGNAQVYDNTRVYDNAWVYGNAYISDNAIISKTSDYMVVQSIGSRNDSITFFKCKDNNIRVNCGCFNGTLDEFRDAVKIKHGDNKFAKEYLMLAELVELRLTDDGLNN